MKRLNYSRLFSEKSRLCKYILIAILSCSFNCSSESSDKSDDVIKVIDDDDEEETVTTFNLNLRVHIMQDIIMKHPTGVIMESWVTPDDIRNTIIPEVNSIWEQAHINWVIESIIEENVVKGDTYQSSLEYIVNSERDENGNSDPERLPHLFSLMQLEHMSTEDEIEKNLFHVYLFPFIGQTSQGNAMSKFNYHTVVGTWTNKHNGGGTPEKTLLTENQSSFQRGSLSRTISHEVGHVLNLSHNECDYGCLMGGVKSDGYNLNEDQIIQSRLEAFNRFIN